MVAQAFQPVPARLKGTGIKDFSFVCYEKFLTAQAGKPVLLNPSFWFFQQEFVVNLLI